jgi:hypothetical protein
MTQVFRRHDITSIPALLTQLRPARFPDTSHVTAVELIELRRDIRRNCDLILVYVYAQLRYAGALSQDHIIVLNQLLRDAHEVRRECVKLTINFLRPRPKRILVELRKTYEEMRLAAILACQIEQPNLIDSLTAAL